jgi:hypothetical protein
MSRSTRAFHRHAEAVLDHELHRARGRLARLPAERRRAVEDVSVRVSTALVDCVLERARSDPSLAQALLSIYGAESAWEPRAVSYAAD